MYLFFSLNFKADVLILLLQIALAKSQSARGASRHPAFIGTYLTIVTHVSLIYLVDESIFLFLVLLMK